MPGQRKVGNLLGLAVLAYLVMKPMHPYELGRTLKENGDARSIKYTHGSLYMVINQLAKAGFIEAQGTSREGQRPERTVYALTPAGRAELRDWMRELVAEPGHEYPRFVAALSLIGALHPDEAVDLLRRRSDRLAEQRTEVAELVDGALADGLPELFLIEEQYRLALLDAEAAFVTELLVKIEDWAPAWAAHHAQLPEGDT